MAKVSDIVTVFSASINLDKRELQYLRAALQNPCSVPESPGDEACRKEIWNAVNYALTRPEAGRD